MPKMIISAEAGSSQGKGCSEVSQRGSQERAGRRRVIDRRGHATALVKRCAANPACPRVPPIRRNQSFEIL